MFINIVNRHVSYRLDCIQKYYRNAKILCELFYTKNAGVLQLELMCVFEFLLYSPKFRS